MKRFAGSLAIILFLIVWTGIFIPQNSILAEEITFVVQRGEGIRDIGLHLEQEGLVPSAPLFRLFVLTTGIAGKLQAGTYLFSSAMSPFS